MGSSFTARTCRRALGAITIVLQLAGCTGTRGGAGPSPSLGSGDLAYTCGRFPFSPALMTAPTGHDELLDNPAAAALRTHLSASGPDIDFLPDSGSTMTGIDPTGAEFVSPEDRDQLGSIHKSPSRFGPDSASRRFSEGQLQPLVLPQFRHL